MSLSLSRYTLPLLGQISHDTIIVAPSLTFLTVLKSSHLVFFSCGKMQKGWKKSLIVTTYGYFYYLHDIRIIIFVIICYLLYVDITFLPLQLNMWIGSRICFTPKQPHTSPLGYQSPASGDNAPEQGSQDALVAQLHHRYVPPTSSHNNNTLANSTPYVSHSCTHQEAISNCQVSHSWQTFFASYLHNGSTLEHNSNRFRKLQYRATPFVFGYFL